MLEQLLSFSITAGNSELLGDLLQPLALHPIDTLEGLPSLTELNCHAQ